MKREEILKKAIEKAVKNGWVDNLGITGQFIGKKFLKYKEYELSSPYQFIFNHNFAKAFWGEEEERFDVKTIDGSFDVRSLPAWQYNLQQMVLEEDPIKYLEKFL